MDIWLEPPIEVSEWQEMQMQLTPLLETWKIAEVATSTMHPETVTTKSLLRLYCEDILGFPGVKGVAQPKGKNDPQHKMYQTSHRVVTIELQPPFPKVQISEYHGENKGDMKVLKVADHPSCFLDLGEALKAIGINCYFRRSALPS